jgi:hypothetical protein
MCLALGLADLRYLLPQTGHRIHARVNLSSVGAGHLGCQTCYPYKLRQQIRISVPGFPKYSGSAVAAYLYNKLNAHHSRRLGSRREKHDLNRVSHLLAGDIGRPLK